MKTPGICRIYTHRGASGALNMALDEALLESVSGEDNVAAFRTYTWTEPTLSLGYFQTYDEAMADPRWRSVAVVRRPTGGGAIWHDREITYAIALPRSSPFYRRNVALYEAVHAAVARLLAERGVAASRRGPAEPAGDRRPFLCFKDRDAEDLVIGAAKVVGSAQRRRAGGILQHGSLLLGQSPLTPELLGIQELGYSVDDPWPALLAQAVPIALGLTPEPTPWTPELLERAEALSLQVYTQQDWTRRR